MRNRKAICTLGILWLLSCAEAQYRLSVDVRPQSTKEGDTLTVKCKVNKTSSSAGEVEIVWVRRMVGERSLDGGRLEAKEVEIGRNATILEDFQRSGKLSASQIYQDFHQIYTLVISDLRSTDSGEVGCRLLNNHIEIFKPIVVHKSPKKVSLMSKNLGNDQATSYQDRERIEFTEAERRNFQCHVREVYPEPRVRILRGREDITDKFNKSVRLTRTLADADVVSLGELSALHYDIIMTSFGLEFTYEFDSNSISCVTDFPGAGLASSSASVLVHLKGYTPKFLCNRDYAVRLHESNFELLCKVLGHPEARSAKVHWKRHTAGNMSIASGQKLGLYQATLLDAPKGDGRTKLLSFRIEHIYPQHFRSYDLEARNAIGTSIHTVNLHQVGTSRLSGSGVPVCTCLRPLLAAWCVFLSLPLLR